MGGNMPDCDLWKAEDLGKKVADKCCDPLEWPEGSGAKQGPPDARTKGGDTKQWACYVQERTTVPGSYTRNYIGCEGDQLQAAEGCAPTGTSMGNGYPMNETLAMSSYEDGSFASCGCETPTYKGNGCFVAATSFIKGLGDDRVANFVKLANDNCAAVAYV